MQLNVIGSSDGYEAFNQLKTSAQRVAANCSQKLSQQPKTPTNAIIAALCKAILCSEALYQLTHEGILQVKVILKAKLPENMPSHLGLVEIHRTAKGLPWIEETADWENPIDADMQSSIKESIQKEINPSVVSFKNTALFKILGLPSTGVPFIYRIDMIVADFRKKMSADSQGNFKYLEVPSCLRPSVSPDTIPELLCQAEILTPIIDQVKVKNTDNNIVANFERQQQFRGYDNSVCLKIIFNGNQSTPREFIKERKYHVEYVSNLNSLEISLLLKRLKEERFPNSNFNCKYLVLEAVGGHTGAMSQRMDDNVDCIDTEKKLVMVVDVG